MATLPNADPNERCFPANFFISLSDTPVKMALYKRESLTSARVKAKGADWEQAKG
jgi:hypothetical protein